MNLTVNRKFILIKLHYFLFNAGVAPLIIFGPTIAKQAGYAAFTVGLMYTVLPLVGLFVKTISGALADKFNKKKFVFVFAIFCCLFSAVCMTLINTPISKKKITLLCHTETFLSTCNERIIKIRRSSILTNRNNTGYINCEVQCEADVAFAQELCENWNHCSTWEHFKSVEGNLENHESMTTPKYYENVTFQAKIEKKHVFKINRCVYALINEEMFNSQESAVMPFCQNHINSTCRIVCDNLEFMNILQLEGSPLLKDVGNLKFWMIFLIFAINWSGMALTNSMSDTVCFDLLGSEANLYGKQRMFGALGWGLVSVLSGWLVDLFSEDYFDKNYKFLFYLGAVLLAIDLVVAGFIKVNKTFVSISIFRDIKLLFSGLRTTIFAFWCFLTGLQSGIVWNFLFWFLEDISTADDLQWSKTLQGLDSLFTTIVGELPFFFISGWILKKLGHIRLMSLVLFAISIRFLGYSLLVKPVWVLPIELVSGFAFSMCYVVIASYSNLIAPVGTESTVQALFSALFDGLGISFGGFIGGIIYYRYGGRFLFRFFGYVSIIIGLLHVFIQYKLDSRSENRLPRDGNHLTDKNSSAKYSSPNDAIMMLENS